MIDPALNQQVLQEIQTRITGLDTIIDDPSSSAAAKADARAAKTQLQQEQALRNRIANARTDRERQQAENELAAFRRRNCPAADDGSSVATCRPKLLFVHLHMRFLLPKQLLTDMRDAAKYPLRAVAIEADPFKRWYSFEGMSIPQKKRWGGEHPVVGATVKLAGQTVLTDANGMARFENVGAGTYTIEIEPPANQDCQVPAGPDLPVRTGYSYDAAPPAKYRRFTVSATVDGDDRWQATPEPTVTLPLKGDSAAYAGVAGVSNLDLYLDWKPDWLKARNRSVRASRTNQAILMHQTATVLHEQIGSPLNWFSDQSGNRFKTAAHYLVDLDGHVVKLVHEAEVANHAGESNWHELEGLNGSGIGIETMHTDYNSDSDAQHGRQKLREFPTEQYGGMNRLVTLLRSTFGITKAYVCGHNDCKQEARECPGDMFDWKTLEDAGNALKVHTGGTFAGNRRVVSADLTADDAAIPLSQELYKIGYTRKEVRVAVTRFVLRAWSGSRLPERPAGDKIEVAPAVKASEGQAAIPEGRQITQTIADAIDQMYHDL